MLIRGILICCIGAALGLGCSPAGPDSNTQVFQTAEQARATRAAKLLIQWSESAVSVLKQDRPDVRATATTQPFAAIVEANGCKLSIDLDPLKQRLMAKDVSERDILREHFRQEMRSFDQDRLIAMQFDGARKLLEPYLLPSPEVPTLAKSAGEDDLAVVSTVMGSTRWTPLARFTPELAVPLSSRVVAAWKKSPAAISQAALDNIKPQLTESAIVSTPFANLGNVGNLKPGVNPAVILLPDFLPTVRKQWQIDDALVMLLASQSDVRFVARGNQKLLDMVTKFWIGAIGRVETPLSRTLLIRDDNGFAPYIPPAVATQPAATAPATKPATRVYIVH